MPVVVCHAPSRMRRCSSARLRTVAIINPQASSGVASRTALYRGLAKFEWATRTPLLAGRSDVQIRQALADDGDQFQVRQSLDERPRKRHPFAYGAHHIERPQCVRGFRLGEVPVENRYLGTGLNRRPVGQVEGHPA